MSETGGRRPDPESGSLARWGFVDPARARHLLASPVLAALGDPEEPTEDGLLAALGEVADPDLALLALVRLLETLEKGPAQSAAARLGEVLAGPGTDRDRLLAVLGASTALGEHLVHHPEQWRSVTEAAPLTVDERIGLLRARVADPAPLSADDALRVGYRDQLLGIAALDLTASNPLDQFPATAAALADLAEAALEAAVDIAREETPDADRARLAIIAMGKTGGRELNYVSDVDVIFVAEPADDVDEDAAIAVATKVASRVIRACSTATGHGSLWTVDPALRPEGKNGPLVRTVASHRVYYERWAKTWEFQALLKARVVAGDRSVGAAYLDAVTPLVWQAASRQHFVEDVQSMRRRVEDHVPAAEADRQLKLGRGGLRDVEFSVQLLQLVHGRTDESLRSATTLDALAALSSHGYVGRDDAAILDTAYRLLRTLEHRIQLFRLRRTHLMPTSPAALRRLGRAVGHRSNPAAAVERQWRDQAREVRRIHERLFYRPLLAAAARLSTDEVQMTPEAAHARLAALGFRDPQGAFRHIEALTAGVSRRAAIQRTLLPVMLGWFADEADPDAGLLAFRRISDELGSTHWYLRTLRDEGTAAERLAHTLARSRYAADLLIATPESVKFLGDAEELVPRGHEELVRLMSLAAGRREDLDGAVTAIRTLRRTELFRIAAADVLGLIGDIDDVGAAVSDLTAAVLDTTLRECITAEERRLGGPLGTRLVIVGMGSLGGRESGYASDADVLVVHDPLPDVDDDTAQERALAVVKEWLAQLGRSGPDPRLAVDTDLRPEGKNGPLVRSLQSYAAYYARWSLVWEGQALLRARVIGGDRDLGRRFEELIDPIRYPVGGLDEGQLREVRRMKARIEAERLPRGADRRTHYKLGSGGLSDVEWAIQLLQLRHAHEIPALRTPSTMEALAAAVDTGLLDRAAGRSLRSAWRLAGRMRNAGLLARGRSSASVPDAVRDLDVVARLIGLPPQSGQVLDEQYRRVTRRGRTAFTETFFESP